LRGDIVSISMTDTSKFTALLDEVTPLRLSLGLSGFSLLAMILATCSALSTSDPLPEPRKPPDPPEKTAVVSDRYKTGFYQAQIDDDCKQLEIRRVGAETLKAGNPYNVEFSGKQKLKVGNKLETESLLLRAVKRRLLVGREGQGLRAQHIVLKITNRTDKFLAYRVITRSCTNAASDYAILTHNAVALKPRQTITRTECLLRDASAALVTRVETLEVTRLGYHYVSRLDPRKLQFEKRTAAGHQYGGLRPCKLLPWREIRQGMRKGDTRWYDVIDFYARHSCDEYTFFRGYRWSAKGPSELPVRPPKQP
jgi:hypothetical protein